MNLFNTKLLTTYALLSCSSAHAITLALYDFDTPGIADVAVTTVATGISASDFSSPSLGFAPGPTSLFTNENLGLADGTGDDIADAFTNGQFFSFTVTADPLFDFTLSSLEFDVTRSGNGANDFSVRSSLDNFTIDLLIGNDAILDGIVSPQTVDLSSIDFANQTEVEFIIIFDDRDGNGLSSSGTSIDNVLLQGTVQPIPEPSSSILLALGGLALASRRKR